MFFLVHLQEIVSRFLNRLFEKKCRKRIKNKDFSIICSTCIGGVIYHRLGMQFLSPTVNLWFKQGEFIKFIDDLYYYINQELVFIPTQYDYPVALLGGGR